MTDPGTAGTAMTMDNLPSPGGAPRLTVPEKYPGQGVHPARVAASVARRGAALRG